MRWTAKNEAFVEFYIRYFNGSRVAREAGYSAKTAYSIANKLLKKPEIQARIAERLAELTMSTDEVLVRLTAQARASMRPFIKVEEDGSVHINLASEEAQKHSDEIKKVKTRRTIRKDGQGKDADTLEEEWVEIELLDVTEARTLLGKHHKLFTEKFEITELLHVEGLLDMLHKVYPKANDGNNDTGG